MTRHESLTARGFELWRSAMRWQRIVNQELRPLKLTHTQFLVLDATDRAEREKGDAVMQREIAELAGLDESTTSSVATRLADRGLLDRGISGGDDSRPWRVIVGSMGRRMLERARPRVVAAAERFFGV
jgi:DNA-binding MarR family transcriptional regulator